MDEARPDCEAGTQETQGRGRGPCAADSPNSSGGPVGCELFEANLQLVLPIAEYHAGRGVALQELVTAGRGGLLVAAQKYEDSRGGAFSDYAVWWIRQAITRTIADHASRTGLPLSLLTVVETLQQDLCRHPTAEEIADETGLDSGYVRDLLGTSPRPVPAALRRAVDGLRGVDREIMELRLGLLEGGSVSSVEEVVARFGVTADHVREVECRTLNERPVLRVPRLRGHIERYGRVDGG